METDRSQKVVPQDKPKEHWMHKQAKYLGEKLVNPALEANIQIVIINTLGVLGNLVDLGKGSNLRERLIYPMSGSIIAIAVGTIIMEKLLNIRNDKLRKLEYSLDSDISSSTFYIGDSYKVPATILTYKGEPVELQGRETINSGDKVLEVPLGFEPSSFTRFTDIFRNMSEQNRVNKTIILKLTGTLISIKSLLERDERTSGVKFVAFPIRKDIVGIDRHPGVKKTRDRSVNVNIFDEYGLKKRDDTEYIFLSVEEVKKIAILPEEEFSLCLEELKKLGAFEFSAMSEGSCLDDQSRGSAMVKAIDRYFVQTLSRFQYDFESIKESIPGAPNNFRKRTVEYITMLRNRFSPNGLQVLRISSIGEQQLKRFPDLIGYDPDRSVKEIVSSGSRFKKEQLLYKLRDLISTYSFQILRHGYWRYDVEKPPHTMKYGAARDELSFDSRKTPNKFEYLLKSFGRNMAMIGLLLAIRFGAVPQITQNIVEPFLIDAEQRSTQVNIIPGPEMFEKGLDITPVWKISAPDGTDKSGYYFTGSSSDYRDGEWKIQGQRYMDMSNNININKVTNKEDAINRAEITLETVLLPDPSLETIIRLPVKYGYDISYVDVVNPKGLPVEFSVFRVVDNSIEVSIKSPNNIAGVTIKAGIYNTNKISILPVGGLISFDVTKLNPNVRAAVEALRQQKDAKDITKFWKDRFRYNLYYNYSTPGKTVEDMLNYAELTEGNCICGICNTFSALSSHGLLAVGLAYLNSGNGTGANYLSVSESHMTALGGSQSNLGEIFDATPSRIAPQQVNRDAELAKSEIKPQNIDDLWEDKVTKAQEAGTATDILLGETLKSVAILASASVGGFISLRKIRQFVEKYKEGQLAKPKEFNEGELPYRESIKTETNPIESIKSVFLKQYPIETLAKVYDVINWFVYGYTRSPSVHLVTNSKFSNIAEFQESFQPYVADSKGNGGFDISQISDLVDKIDSLPYVKDFTDKEKKALTEIIRFYWE